MKIFLFTLALALCYLPDLCAQANWQPASITLADGQVQTGKIDDRYWQAHFDQVKWRAGLRQEAIQIPISAIQQFSIHNHRYEVHQVTIDPSPRAINQLIWHRNRQKISLTAPLQVLIEGPISLYVYLDQRGNHHFFIRRNGNALEYLKYGRYKVEGPAGKTAYREVTHYQGQLKEALASCNFIGMDIGKLKYQQNALLRLIEKYYSCGRERPFYWVPPQRGVWQFGADLGFVKGTPTYSHVQNPIFPFSGVSDWGPGLGVHAKYRFGGPSGRVAVKLGGWHHSFTAGATEPDLAETDPMAKATYQFVFNERSLHFQLGPEVILARSRFPMFLETLLEYQRVLAYQESRYHTRTVDGQTTAEGVAYDFSNQGAFGLSIGAGLGIGPAKLSIRGSATKRRYPGYILNLYRIGVVGSYDF
ncbi:MAG: hypothetical protein AAF840_04315 [Bacteroidota bacterium]